MLLSGITKAPVQQLLDVVRGTNTANSPIDVSPTYWYDTKSELRGTGQSTKAIWLILTGESKASHSNLPVGPCRRNQLQKKHPELLGHVPLPFRDVHGQFRLKKEPDIQRFLAAGNSEGLPGVSLGVEVDGAGKCIAGGFDLPEPRESECLDAILAEIQGEQIPVSMIGQQVVGVQFVFEWGACSYRPKSDLLSI